MTAIDACECRQCLRDRKAMIFVRQDSDGNSATSHGATSSEASPASSSSEPSLPSDQAASSASATGLDPQAEDSARSALADSFYENLLCRGRIECGIAFSPEILESIAAIVRRKCDASINPDECIDLAALVVLGLSHMGWQLSRRPLAMPHA